MKLEHTAFGLQVKFVQEDDTRVGSFSGYGAIFGNTDSYGDVIQKGAFKDTLREWKKRRSMPKMLLQHGSFMGPAEDGIPIGKWNVVEEDDTGLKVEGELFALDTQKGKYIYEGLKAGALDGLSIGYIAREVAYGKKPEDPPRTLKKVDLFEVSVVTFPANEESRIDAVKSDDFTERDFERLLTRDAGFTRSDAITIINDGFKALRRTTRDAGRASETADHEFGDLLIHDMKSLFPGVKA